MSFALKDNKYLWVLACWLVCFKARSCYPELVNLGSSCLRLLSAGTTGYSTMTVSIPLLSMNFTTWFTLHYREWAFNHYLYYTEYGVIWERRQAAFEKVSVMMRSLSEGTTSAKKLCHKINNQNCLNDRTSGKGPQVRTGYCTVRTVSFHMAPWLPLATISES